MKPLTISFLPEVAKPSFKTTWDMLADNSLVTLEQFWNTDTDFEFRPTHVKFGWTNGGVIVVAVLQDEDIFNPVAENHLPAFLSGDVFEIFFRPEGQTSYREFHINPHNAKYQLCIPSEIAFREAKKLGRGTPEAWTMQMPLIESQVWIEPEQLRWKILVKIPFTAVLEQGESVIGDRWLFSCSRYDYTRGVESPVLSSTSAHSEIDFHRQQDWGTLEFCE